MFKRIAAAVLSVAVVGLLFVLFFQRGTDNAPTDDAGEGFTVGVGRLNGNFSPFFEEDDGDREVKELILSKMMTAERDTSLSASYDSPCVAESFEVFYADKDLNRTEEFAEGGYTALSLVLKPDLVFSNGKPLTADDAVFTLYAMLDPLSECDKTPFAALAGYNDYSYGIKGVSEAMAKGNVIITTDVGDVPAGGDGFTDAEAADMREILTSCGAEYAERIKSYVLDKYCTDETVSSYVFTGITPDDVKSSEALSNAYAMRMWNYGAFLYDYVEDAEGDLVGTIDALGNIVYKTTYEAAMESEGYLSYVYDGEGEYSYDPFKKEYVPAEDDYFGQRYSRVLSDKYIRISKTALAGFRDTEGNSYTLQGDSFPTMADFFKVMKESYVTENGFDYADMEKIESVDDYSFSEEAIKQFALTHSEGGDVTEIFGIKTDTVQTDNGERERVTLYFTGNDFNTAYYANFPVVSKSACLDGFEDPDAKTNPAGAPIASASFFERLKDPSVSAVSCGPYVFDKYDAEGGEVFLVSNRSFDVFGKGIAATERVTLKDISEKDAVSMLSDGEIMLSLAPVTKDNAATAGDDENVKTVYYPNGSYKYILINPARYKHIDARRAIASVLDVSLLYSESTSAARGFVPVYFDSYTEEPLIPYDGSGAYAANAFESAGYTKNDAGELIDPSTKEKAVFDFYLLPEEEGGKTEQMLNGAANILRSLGADAGIVYDADLKTRVYSEEDIPIFVLGWEIDRNLSLFERYAYSSSSNAVKGCGLEKLYSIGQIDTMGTLSYTLLDGNEATTTQSEAVEALDNTIRFGLASISRSSRNSYFACAAGILGNLTIEIPLCEYNNAYLVRQDLVDQSTLYQSPTPEKGPLSEIWNVRLTDAD